MYKDILYILTWPREQISGVTPIERNEISVGACFIDEMDSH